nr:dephospho-CoA kinase [Angustibacter aerolatus]
MRASRPSRAGWPSLGAVVVDADVLARQVLEPGTPGLAEVVREFGAAVLTEDGVLDRAALARAAFSSDDRRRALEAITHPRIAAATQQAFEQAAPDAVVVHDVPLLVERDLAARYDVVVVVDAPVEVRVRRLVEQRGMAEDDVRRRIAAQADDAARRAVADVWVDTDRPVADVLADVDRLWTERLLPAERATR